MDALPNFEDNLAELKETSRLTQTQLVELMIQDLQAVREDRLPNHLWLNAGIPVTLQYHAAGLLQLILEQLTSLMECAGEHVELIAIDPDQETLILEISDEPIDRHDSVSVSPPSTN